MPTIIKMPKQLLFLNSISKQVIETFNNENEHLNISCQPLIQTQEITFNPHDLDPSIPWIFTSQTAVNAVLKYPLSKTIYCIGQKTSSAIPHAITPSQSTAKHLAKRIIKSNEKKVIFICGDKRRDELPQRLKNNGISVKEVIVYETNYLNKSVNLQEIDGLAFMSPSAVFSMNENGGFNNLPCFAIGPTTAQALESLNQKWIMSQQTDVSSMLEMARKYFLI